MSESKDDATVRGQPEMEPPEWLKSEKFWELRAKRLRGLIPVSIEADIATFPHLYKHAPAWFRREFRLAGDHR